MIVTTTNSVEGKSVEAYKGIVFGETIMGANVVRDLFASVTDFLGGRSGAYESKLQDARQAALQEMEVNAAALGADAIIGISFDYGTVGDTMLMVTVTGTAVTLK